MSELERNKGTLCEVGTVEEMQGNMDEFEFFDFLEEKGMMKINDKVYTVAWKVKSDRDCSFFAEVEELDDGTIAFHTMHYNGGGSLEEVLESYLKEGKENE